MTTETRRQMQNYKKKAIEIEKRIRDRKQYSDMNNEDIKSECSQSSHCKTGGNVSQRSQEQYENKFKESEESLNFLQNMIKRQQGVALESSGGNMKSGNHRNITIDIESYDSAENLAKMKKLQKSEILIYDNSKNEIIQVLAGQQENSLRLERKNDLPPKKPTHLLLAGVDGKGLSSIPSICLNPPTPLTVNKHISDSLESLVISENHKQIPSIVDEHSSEESANSMRTHSDKVSTRNVRRNTAKSMRNKNSISDDQKSPTSGKNVIARIQQFEAINNDCNTPHLSPEMSCKPRNTCLETLSSGTMNRSATSPSIKLSASNRSSSSRSQCFVQDSDNSPENSLVRSSSFTLEAPSKVLIAHMRQQKTICANKPAEKSPTPTTARATTRKPPLRAHRDTVESKAKKVQKVELKSSKQKIQQKTSQSKLAQAAVVSISPYSTLALNPTTNNLYKTKKSPYDISKTSHTSLQNSQKTSSVQMRKSNSSSSNLSQSKSSKSRGLLSTSSTPTSVTNNESKTVLSTGKETLPLMDKIQKEKFQRLLAQQEEEQRRLQQSFEMQQKLLLEQLNRDVGAFSLKSQTNSSCNSSPRYKKPNHLQDKLNPLSPTVSNSKNPSHISNTTHLSYPTHYAQSPQTSTLTSSHLSSMDYSNANTSLDISMLSTQTSPETVGSTPHAKQNHTNNGSGNNTVPLTSSSRRRLFPTEVNFVETPEIPLSSRSVASSPSYAIGQESMKPVQQLNQNNKNSSLVTTNGSTRRVSLNFFMSLNQ